MFGAFALAALIASASLQLVRADVVPSVPGPGVVYRVGGTCHIEWDGDADSTTAWKGMNIQLMTGDNFNMIPLTTVGTNLDGTVSGTYDHPCPAVTPNSAIYFYQFTAPGSPDKTWTTRFTIASANGDTTPPANPTQPGSNEAIPWGVGALVDPSTAVPPPASANQASNAVPSAGSTASPSVSPSPASGTGSATPATASPTGASPSGFTTVNTASTSTASGPAATGNSTTGSSTKDNAAASVVVDARLSQAGAILLASAMAFTILL
ncbi:hypothetical protein H0H81_000707 [Sphagnurus paluster]|uniref:Yeast cell wall synthesis Kre9/Knh1-like N-terminal domain-containing protein n=1 Tax=Sphagnurus paluster TaxID=117069 RepID=A0A9P7K2Z5_9AGAR|nr:hypothetical protein H0H81_000707 [Sphagnurus paluster]